VIIMQKDPISQFRGLFNPRDLSAIRAVLAFSSLCFVASHAPAQSVGSSGSFNAVGSMNAARYLHTSTLLNNGKVLIAGGTAPVTGGFATTKSAELYDPATGTFTPVGDMISDRDSHTATLLPNGRVLIAGGVQRTVNGNVTYLDTAELFDPVTGTFAALAPMNAIRQEHTATLLPNGKVLIVGGDFDPGYNIPNATNDTAELFDPASGSFTLVANHTMEARSAHTATLLRNGDVLLAGGYHLEGPFATPTDSAEVFDPVSGSFTGLASRMSSVRYYHTATLLATGKVLIAAGAIGSTVPFLGAIPVVTNVSHTAELFDPSSGTFTLISPDVMTSPRAFHSATLLPNGKVLLAGGYNGGVGGPTIGPTAYNNTAELFDPASNTFISILPNTMSSARSLHTAILLADGRVLLAGGFNGSVILSTAELFDYPGGSFSPTGSLVTGRFYHTATPLSDGRVLIAGGTGAQVTIATAELFDPLTGTFSPAANTMISPRYAHTATLLSDGKVLIAAGLVGTTLLDLAPSDQAELFDPYSESFAALPAMTSARVEYSATLLANGKVLFAGGYKSTTYLKTAELFDPTSGTFSALSHTMTTERHGHTATLLNSGKVLIAGGEIGLASIVTNTAEIFDPLTETFTPLTSTMNVARSYHTATLLPNGKVLLAGGYAAGAAPNYYTNTAELFDPGSNSFVTVSNMSLARDGHTATLLPSGKVLITGGIYNPALAQGPTNTSELFDPVLGTFTFLSTNTMSSARENHTATLLPTGQVMICGGINNSGLPGPAEIFDVGLGFADSRRPLITGATDPVLTPASLVLNGWGFRGDSQADGGSSQSSGTNYPVLQLMRIDNEQVFFALSDPRTNWSDTMFSSETFGTTATQLPNGRYRVTLFVNAIPSFQKVVDIERLKPPEVPLTSAVSRKAHGNFALFDIPLSLTGSPGIECRSGGPNGDHTIVFTFANQLSSVDGATVSRGIGTVSSAWMSSDLYQYVVNLTGVANAQAITIRITNVSDSVGNFSSAISALMGVLLGDVNGSGRVDAADVSLVRQQTLQPITSSNFREDINTSDRIDASDVSIARQQTLTSLP
jgi:hypothetical protein